MKILIKTAVGVDYTKGVAKEVKSMFKDLDFNIDFTVEEVTLDLSHSLLWETTYSWSFLKLTRTKSFSSRAIYAWHKPPYDSTCVFIPAGTQEEKGLQGQFSIFNDVAVIEVYSKDTYVRKTTRNNKTSYSDTNRRTDLKRDVRVLFHEVLHVLENKIGNKPTDLHIAEKQDRLMQYAQHVIAKLNGNVYPIKEWETTVSQQYGVTNWDLYPVTGKHWGVDHAVPVGTPIYATHDGFLREDTTNVGALGTHCLYSFWEQGELWTLLFAHLSEVKGYGEYKKGDVIAYTGDTGFIKGVHLHTELWKGLIINRERLADLTVNPVGFYDSI